MLEWEFEKLLGRKATQEEYVKANAVYMACSLNKEVFCKEWEAVKDSKLVYDLQSMVSYYVERAAELRKQLAVGGYVVSLCFDLGKEYIVQLWYNDMPSYNKMIADAKKLRFSDSPVTEEALKRVCSIVNFVRLNKYEMDNFMM